MKSGFVLATAITGLVLTAPPLSAQVSISGTDCTLSGGTRGNLYTISGDLLPSDTIAWTVTGGYLVANGNARLSGTIANKGTQVRIIWNSGGGAHQLQLSHKRLGMASLNVRVTDMDVSIHAPVLAVAPGAAVT
ncbi:hypothetical protein, partial [Puia dinghuensis]|uniref:hypothetical protein n=1 Tax=Puia dinghuensis TaxID=1792502 RepID=UPI00166E14D6